MWQFLGQFEIPVDDKGRVFVPVELRRKMPPEAADTLIVTRGFDRCLIAYPLPEWEKVAAKIMQLPQTDPDARMLVRSMLSQAAETRLDRQGRIAVPKMLLGRAGIADRMVIVGQLTRMEMWNPADWQPTLEEADGKMERVARNYML